MPRMKVVRTIEELRQVGSPGENAFVPTMGALHEGHVALIRRAAASSRPVVVSIFVNPTQFAPDEDYKRYPRQLEADCEVARDLGVDVAFAPDVETMYPPGDEPTVPLLPDVATLPRLEDAFRPGHFAGVCQVVARLFDLVQPRLAVFGEKDYQQLLVIRTLAAHEPRRWANVEIVGVPTVREQDGLALSSRNAYLSPAQHERALGLIKALRRSAESHHPESAQAAMHDVLRQHELKIDYAVVRDAATLMPIETFGKPARALIAAHVDDVRLIDNAAIPERDA